MTPIAARRLTVLRQLTVVTLLALSLTDLVKVGASDVIEEVLTLKDIDEDLLRSETEALLSGTSVTTKSDLQSRTLDAPNLNQQHPVPRSLFELDALQLTLDSLSPMTFNRSTKALASARAPGAQDLKRKFSAQYWPQDPLNNGFQDFRFITWWHIFNVAPLTKYEVVARIYQQIARSSNVHFSNQNPKISFYFGGATFYSGTEAAGWVCNQPNTYRAIVSSKQPGSRVINTVICNRGDGHLGESSFPYDNQGVVFPLQEEDPRHVMQIDPSALPGGVYGTDVTNLDGRNPGAGHTTTRFNAPTWSHLVGHLFGIPHVFQDDGVCPARPELDNDRFQGITDTPVQQFPYSSTEDCTNAAQLKDCGDTSSPYQLNNIMGHALCATQFSASQYTRMGAVIREYHYKKAARQDCGTNQCGVGQLCVERFFGAVLRDDTATRIGAGTIQTADRIVSMPFSVLAAYGSNCTNSTILSPACIAATNRWCAQNTDDPNTIVLKLDRSTGFLQFHCSRRVNPPTKRFWTQFTNCQYADGLGIYDPVCINELTAVSSTPTTPVEVTPSFIRFAAVDYVDNIAVPLAAFKLLNKNCNQKKDFIRQECREAMQAYGANQFECSCTNGRTGACTVAQNWVVDGWQDCMADCTQSRSVTCNGGDDSACDAARKPSSVRDCAFGDCIQDTPNNACSGAVDIPADTSLLPEERFKPRSSGDTPVEGDYDASPDWGSACNGSHIAAWYKIRYPFTFNLEVKVRSASTPATLALLQGSCAGIVQAACAPNALDGIIATTLVANVQYYVRVASTNNVTGSFDLAVSVTRSGAESGDTCEQPVPIIMPADGIAYINNTLNRASPTANLSSVCGRSAASPDIWYSYSPAIDGQVYVSLSDLSPKPSFDLVMSIHGGTACNALTLLACVDDTPSSKVLAVTSKSNPGSISTYMFAGQLYRIRVSTYNGIRPALGFDVVYLHVRHVRAQIFTFVNTTDWSACDSNCVQSRTVVCRRVRDNATFQDEYCDRVGVVKLESVRTCSDCSIQGDSPNSCVSGVTSVLNNTEGVSLSRVGNLSDDKVASLNSSDLFRAPVCGTSRNYRDFWYTFTSKQTSLFTAFVGRSAWVLTLYFYPISPLPDPFPTDCGSMELGTCGSAGSVQQVVQPGRVYFLRVARPASDVNPYFTLTHNFTRLLDNNDCDIPNSNIIVMNSTQVSGAINVSFAFASPSSGYGLNARDIMLNPSCGSSVDSKNLFYRVGYYVRGMLQVWIDSSAPNNKVFKGVLSLHSGCNRAYACAVYNSDDASPSESNGLGLGRLTSVELIPGRPTPYIRVASFDNTVTDEQFVLRWQFTPSEPRLWRLICDQVLQEVVLNRTQLTGSVTLFNTGLLSVNDAAPVTKWASATPAICGTSQDSRAQWMQITTQVSGRLTVQVSSASFDTVLSLHTSSFDCTGRVPDSSIIACDDDSGSEFNPLLRSYVTAGKTYLVRLAGNRNATGTATVSVTLDFFRPTGNAFWWKGPWTRCSAGCGQTRLVKCLNRADQPIAEKLCPGPKPRTQRECTGQDCPVAWVTGDWSQCTAACEQTRSFSCQIANQQGYNTVKNDNCPRSVVPVERRVCIGGVCPAVKNETVVDLIVQLKAGFDRSLSNVVNVLNDFRTQSLCPTLQLALPYYSCAASSSVLGFTYAGRGTIRFTGANCREALTEALDFMNNGVNEVGTDEESFILRQFVTPEVEGLPAAATVYATVLPSSSSNRNRNIGLGIGLTFGLIFLIVLAVLSGIYISKRLAARNTAASQEAAPADIAMSPSDTGASMTGSSSAAPLSG